MAAAAAGSDARAEVVFRAAPTPGAPPLIATSRAVLPLARRRGG